MPIKEEPVRIEFQYEQEDAVTSDGVFNVEYFSEKDGGKEKKYVRVTPHGTTVDSIFELDFLVEVVDFLRKKGVVDEQVVEEIIPEGAVFRNGLKLPKIQTFGTKAEGSPIGIEGHAPEVTINNHNTSVPISTFVTNGDESQILAPPVVHNSQAGEPTVIASPKIISATDGAMPVINRPVIRTRIKENEDPMVALEESRRQRKTNPEKSIKRKEAADEV